MECKKRGLAGDLIVKIYGVDEIKGTEVPAIVLGPTKGGIDHHGTICVDGILEGIMCDSVVVTPTHTTVLYTLTL